ncbi:SCO0930 family lipoprotein [Streptomyces sp. NPDC048383]|uniref:SCO0930 family lipoprotein n=1 Tax=Streptomyces sp. NPDC048383 TaxID=3155386 RepID=UPI00343AB8B6
MISKRRAIAVGSVAAVLMFAAGCGGGTNATGNVNSVQPVGDGKAIGKDSGYGSGGYGSDAAAGSGSGSGSAAGGSAAEKAGAAGKLAVRAIASVGSVVTDSAGATLYRFDKDTPKPPKSSCDGDCATVWPPVPADDATAAEGIEAGLLGEVTRTDGSRQLTLAGWPVYRYAKDTKPGEAKGEGVGGTWHALAPDGKKAIDAKGDAKGGAAGEGADDAAGNAEGGTTGEAAKPEAGGAEEAKPAAAAELAVASNEKLGRILVDGKGNTLYRFDKDSAWPMKLGCLGACLDTWKPAPVVDKTKVSGIPQEWIGSVKRPDGSMQLTIDCWPVYTFTGDTAPGQTNGHGKQNLWFAVNDAGKKVAPVQ